MNEERILKLADYIEQLPPQSFCMALFAAEAADNLEDAMELDLVDALKVDPEHPCGTVGCIAGWTCILFRQEAEQIIEGLYPNQPSFRFAYSDVAAEVLGLDRDTAHDLFFCFRDSTDREFAADRLRKLLTK